ncbi:dynein regulator [Trichoderma longibrachiatum ATCC 18648]|uniref:Mitochondrial division protein 1 n=1 Tax=Trichoderma longibrachiatum ATCC 18648 TaxID=983965 RepID=A0A2T4C7C6_TRILO|nr:dynein regulator [Trichoderma longibrachiatum ATCC 18648]
MSRTLPVRQAEELHKSIIAYLAANNLAESATVLRQELGLGEDVFDAATTKKYEGLLEKKWTSIVRLQKKACIMDLETRNAELQSEVDNATPSSLSQKNKDPVSWLPKPPSRHTLESHRASVNCVAFHPRFTSIASGSEDCTIKIWDWELGDLEQTIKGHTRPVLDLDYGGPKTGILLASCSSDTTIKLWDPADGYKNIRTLSGHEHSVSAVRFIPSGGTGFFSSGNMLVSGCAGLKKPPPASSTAEFMATGSRDKTIKLWDARGNCIKTLVGHDNWVSGVMFHPGGKYLLSVADDKSLRCWDLSQDGKCVRTLSNAHEHFITSLRWAPAKPKDTPAGNGTANEGEGTPRRAAAALDISDAQIRCVVATGSVDMTVKIWAN